MITYNISLFQNLLKIPFANVRSQSNGVIGYPHSLYWTSTSDVTGGAQILCIDYSSSLLYGYQNGAVR